ncbi:MAG: N-acetyl-gamma-glutamyl-phosphate reductase [Betaproteobacteria bacterium TMED41]|nr:MAG: N-acetyl-gamma-glutamyl-phosphate reductase [Betaproteobacteria bacterium TMED41]
MINVGVVGASGYTGLELLRILRHHPNVDKILIAGGRSNKSQNSQIFKPFENKKKFHIIEYENKEFKKCDVVFFATPHGVAMEKAYQLIKLGTKVIDLSADFRLKDSEDFSKWYGLTHSEEGLLKEAVYGLPEIYREKIKTSRIVAMPGCYPTAVILGFFPLLKANLVDTNSLIADCKSGVSGAGKTPKTETMFSEISENFKAYGLTGHRHWPEIYQELNAIMLGANRQDSCISNTLEILFSPHLVPMIRGIEATLYCKLKEFALGVDIKQLYEQTYATEPFVEVLPDGINPETASVRGLNTIKIALSRPSYDKTLNSNKLVVYVVEDNLVKGASGQAVQVMNIMFDLNECEGLELIGFAS